MTETLLDIRDLTVSLGRKGWFGGGNRTEIVKQASLSLNKGEILAIVGESGSGKTTIGRAILGMLPEDKGEIRLQGKLVSGLEPRAARQARSIIQYVHQDAGSSLDPWWKVGSTLEETAKQGASTEPADARIDRLLQAVGLSPDIKRRYPHELSGGQQRRVALARILLLDPQILILDEPTSGLDVSIQAAVLGLLQNLRKTFGVSYLFISHDLGVVRLIADRIAVMEKGRIVEQAETEALFSDPQHPYTKKLLESRPRIADDVPETGTRPAPASG